MINVQEIPTKLFEAINWLKILCGLKVALYLLLLSTKTLKLTIVDTVNANKTSFCISIPKFIINLNNKYVQYSGPEYAITVSNFILIITVIKKIIRSFNGQK